MRNWLRYPIILLAMAAALAAAGAAVAQTEPDDPPPPAEWVVTGEAVQGETVNIRLSAPRTYGASGSGQARYGQLESHLCGRDDLTEADMFSGIATREITETEPFLDVTQGADRVVCFWGAVLYSGHGQVGVPDPAQTEPAIVTLRWRSGNVMVDGLGAAGIGQMIVSNTPGGAWMVVFALPLISTLISLGVRSLAVSLVVFLVTLFLAGFIVGFSIYFAGLFLVVLAIAALIVVALRGGIR